MPLFFAYDSVRFYTAQVILWADNLPSRCSIRLPGFDYVQTGRYFVTICACDMQCLFGRVENDAVLLGPIGQIADSCWREIPKHFLHVGLDAFVVMPNHVHGILILENEDGHGSAVPLLDLTHEAFQRPVAGSVPTIIRSYKSAVTWQAAQQLRRKGMRLWQSNYFERVLRNDKEYLSASRYILENPRTWHRDKVAPAAARHCRARLTPDLPADFDLR